MRFTMLILAGLSIIYGIAGLPMMYQKGLGYFIYALVIEGALLFGFCLCRKKYYTPERKKVEEEKRRLKQERQESLKKQRAAVRAAQELQKKKRTTIVTTCILDASKAKHYKMSSVIFRATVGGLFAGQAGGLIGGLSAKKHGVIFLVQYEDGHIEEREAYPGTSQYNLYMFYLDRKV